MIHRFQTLSSLQKIFFISASSLFLLIILFTAFILIQKNSNSPTVQQSNFNLQYCGVNPKKLCILSFGRSDVGNTIINFFVPNKNFPEFYLIVKKTDTESKFQCRRSTEIKTNVFCIGESLSLKQTIEIDMFTEKDNRLLATNKFLIEAFLISTPIAIPVTPEVATDIFQLEETTITEIPTEETTATAYPEVTP